MTIFEKKCATSAWLQHLGPWKCFIYFQMLVIDFTQKKNSMCDWLMVQVQIRKFWGFFPADVQSPVGRLNWLTGRWTSINVPCWHRNIIISDLYLPSHWPSRHSLVNQEYTQGQGRMCCKFAWRNIALHDTTKDRKQAEATYRKQEVWGVDDKEFD